ncbi:trehalase-like domain-containing protein [Amycolatopsis sp. VS8301801F10]|uniref:trehalase-like domain-containing protein n=1 Tax=Amycolatopsis sp. VS8301801F10 TaxID=2652442 RepID=UPI0038FC6D90
MPRSPGVEWSIASDGPQDTATSSVQPTPELPLALELRHHGSRRAWTVRSGPPGPGRQLDDAESGDHREVPQPTGLPNSLHLPGRPTHRTPSPQRHQNRRPPRDSPTDRIAETHATFPADPRTEHRIQPPQRRRAHRPPHGSPADRVAELAPPSRRTHTPHTEPSHLNDTETRRPPRSPPTDRIAELARPPGGATTALTESGLLTDALAQQTGHPSGPAASGALGPRTDRVRVSSRVSP